MLIVQEQATGFVQLNWPGPIHAGGMIHQWEIVDVWSDQQLADIDIYRVAPAQPPEPDQVAMRWHFAWQDDRVVQVVDEWASTVPPPSPDGGEALTLALEANARLDAGIEAGKQGLGVLDELPEPGGRRGRRGDEPATLGDLDDLMARLGALTEALRATLTAHIGRQPRRRK